MNGEVSFTKINLMEMNFLGRISNVEGYNWANLT
jgi:hypothetical protein